ncbi:MAG: hypothetical protein AB1664_06870, partial [Thermodesulfobacteriota bacterium]
AVTPEGVRELVALETSGRLAKDVSKLKYLPFQIDFRERYPSAWISHDSDLQDGQESDVIQVGEDPDANGELPTAGEAASSGSA